MSLTNMLETFTMAVSLLAHLCCVVRAEKGPLNSTSYLRSSCRLALQCTAGAHTC